MRDHTIQILKSRDTGIINDWLAELKANASADGRISESELQSQAREFIDVLGKPSQSGVPDLETSEAAPLRSFLENLSRARAAQGFTTTQTATFVFSLKKPIFRRLRQEFGNDPTRLTDETWAASELIDRLAMFTATAFQKTREELDLFSALRGMFKPIINKQSVDLLFEVPKNVPLLFTDHKKLSQILRNYISNALKFTQKGVVRVSAECKDSEMVTFWVADTGIGIAKEHQEALFNDFVQVDSPIQKRFRGTGLGLSLSKKLAELLGGRVGIESELGKGSTFSVTVPVRLPGYTDNENREESQYAG